MKLKKGAVKRTGLKPTEPKPTKIRHPENWEWRIEN